MREQTGKNAQRPQTGSAIHAFNIGANTFMAYTYTMQPRLQLAVRSLQTQTTGDFDAGTSVLFPTTPWRNIYMSVYPVGIGAIRTAADADGTDMYLYMPPSTLARYRISPAKSTEAVTLPADDSTITITRNGNTLRLTGTYTATVAQLSITDISGRTILSVPANHPLDIGTLAPGLYIAHTPGAAPLKFTVH